MSSNNLSKIERNYLDNLIENCYNGEIPSEETVKDLINKAKEISEEFIQRWEVWQIVGFLDKFGIGVEYAKKVFDLFGTNAIEKIEENPYVLIDITRGVDFRQIDKIALDMDMDLLVKIKRKTILMI